MFRLKTLTFAFASALLTSSAQAGASAMPIPEPDMLSLFAIGVIAAVLVRRSGRG